MATAIETLGTVLLALGLSVGLLAQESEPQAERVAPAVAGNAAEEPGSPAEEARPDTRPITGFLPLTLGSFGTERSFLAPSFNVSQSFDTNPGMVSGPSETVTATNLSANAVLQEVWRRSQFSLSYTGGGSIYAAHSDVNSIFQAARIQQAFQFRRWSLTLADDVSYTPGSLFPYLRSSSLGASSFVPGVAPNQTVLTNTNQITNATVGQMSYYLNKRSSLTVAADFGLQRFYGGNFLDSDQGGVLVGYNYNLNPRDSLGLSYGLNLVRVGDGSSSQKLDSHNVQLGYGRRITGRLALSVSGGPQVNLFRDPTPGSVTHVTWTAQSSLIYRFRRVQTQISYVHSVNAGSGVLGLSEIHQIGAGFTTRLTRMLSGSFQTGYAHNNNLQGVGLQHLTFDTEFMEAHLERPLGSQAKWLAFYAFQHQVDNVLGCGSGFCGDLNRHSGGVGFEWHMRPLVIR